MAVEGGIGRMKPVLRSIVGGNVCVLNQLKDLEYLWAFCVFGFKVYKYGAAQRPSICFTHQNKKKKHKN